MSEKADLMEHIEGKWFKPIADRLQAFEDSSEVFAEFGDVAKPHSPEWAVQGVIKAIKPFGEMMGMPMRGVFEAQQIGAMVGAKASVCRAMAEAHTVAQGWSPESRKKFVSICGLEGTKYAESTWRTFSERLHPECEEIRRFAVATAMQQSYLEDLEFLRGLTKGLTLMQELRKTIRKAITKAERDAQSRTAVYFFAAVKCEAIEAKRRELSWPELAEGFDKAFKYQIPIDEDAFKKILQRCGLGVGKPGRRIPISI